MKKWIQLFLVCTLFLTTSGCAKKQEYTEIPVTMDEVQEMMDHQEDFILLVERENCSFCQRLHDYIEETKKEHNDVTIYILDTTEFHFKKESQDSNILAAETEEGKAFLKEFPYFMYTPSIYVISSGDATVVGSGFDATTKEISLWDVDSVIDFNRANVQNFWSYVEEADQ